ncbi:hypothetical protein [Spirosoma endbachense]|uniref:Uncharacterized protein n=1 Tax=Spirosoma endbachense TaxID=2666025 RepID=A0A6P1VT83_9BACT|nr:hypothetical protein [Spirosoma endbachense]QHV96303.1 hypothetical protein GJR95_15320 [Spirosoma endbachense]
MKKLLSLYALLWLTVSGYGQGIQNVKIRQMPKPGPFLYNVSTIRDITTYPLTTAGLNSFTAAASSGAFSLTVNCPCGDIAVIPAGTKPPLVPPCATNCTSAPSWGSSWYDYDGTTLTIRATGDDMVLRFERQDGQPISTINPDNVHIDHIQFFGHATINGVYQWQANFTNAPPLKLTYKRVSDNATFVKLLTPANGANNVNLFLANSGGGSGCDYNLVVNSPSVSCGASTTLTAVASGTAATGLTYSWSSGQTTPSIVITAPSSNGSYGYTVTTSKAGCSPKSSTGTVSVSGCVVQPGTVDFVSQTDEGWINSDATDLKFIENSVIKIGFRRSVGATLCYAAFKSTSRNLINDYQVDDARFDDPLGRYQKVFSDKGRQAMLAGSIYWTPGSGWQVVPGKNTNQYGFDTGGNVVQGGSLGNYYDESQIVASRIYTHPKYGQMFYAKIRPRVWAVPDEFVDIYEECWVWLQGETSTIGYYARQIVGPGIINPQMKYEGRSQELPCVYAIAPLTYQRMADANATPWTNAPTVDRFKYGFSANNNFTKAYATPECWASLSEGADGVTLALYTPGIDRGDGVRVGLNSRFNMGQFVGVFGDWKDNACSYANANQFQNYDNPGIYENSGYLVMASSLADARSKINALPRPDQTFDFSYTDDNHRWWNLDCRLKKESGLWNCYIGDTKTDNNVTSAHGQFISPYGAWDASQIHTIEFDMAVTGISALWVEWYAPGEENDITKQHRKAITLTGDGVRRTYSFSTSDPAWTGTIATIGLRAIRDDGSQGALPITNGGKIIPYRIRKVN